MANEKRLIVNALKKYHDAQFTPGVYEHSIFGKAPMLLEVDAVEVCRCKDCKHYKPQNQGAHRNCTTPYCMRVVAVKVSPDDFCSYGERRNNAPEKPV